MADSLIALELVVLVLTFVSAGWLLADAKQRGRRSARWMVLALVIGPLALIPWLISRRRSPISEHLGLRRKLALYGLGGLVVVSASSIQILTTTFACQVARIEGQAMSPTLRDQDRIIVNKLTYRFGEPMPGDIVMLRYPIKPDKLFVKRVIAAGGERVRIVQGQVYRNDERVEDGYVAADARSHENWGPAVVPPAHFFVMGDRRNNSSDSRHWGFVPRAYMLGRVGYRWWPSISRVGD